MQEVRDELNDWSESTYPLEKNYTLLCYCPPYTTPLRYCPPTLSHTLLPPCTIPPYAIAPPPYSWPVSCLKLATASIKQPVTTPWISTCSSPRESLTSYKELWVSYSIALVAALWPSSMPSGWLHDNAALVLSLGSRDSQRHGAAHYNPLHHPGGTYVCVPWSVPQIDESGEKRENSSRGECVSSVFSTRVLLLYTVHRRV